MENTLATWWPMAAFFFVSSITPGPNNIMLASSGLRHGFRRSVPHMLGISAGCMAMLLVVGMGAGQMFVRWPLLHTLLKLACGAYLLHLAWRTATAPTSLAAAPAASAPETDRPLSFWQAAAFQWVNPKVWAMILGVVALYIPSGPFALQLALAALIAGAVNLPSISVWTWFGVGLRHWLRSARRMRAFNRVMAALLVASLVPILGM
ncbi:hypothetical protein AAV94_13580 [Lampropedia cohaerens]|uniref:Lysine transporter LysE n=1 Tax=Lampropedia cohaerens TaxID=1610491 RepID=A0A0U1PWF2_9BURK|nr:LysE family translocator [Lampropedia cohaerens]KKW66786.1 hypothetical protein AAV94_13580 [Lampropedia cohaerens]